MRKATKWALLLFLAVGILAFSSCAVLKKNDCGCPPIPSTGKMKH